MNKEKSNGYTKLLVFFLIAVILVFAFGLVADGWQIGSEDGNSGNPDGPTNDGSSGNADENKSPENEQEKEEIQPPKFYDALSGLECTEEISRSRPIAYVLDPASPLYGASSAEMIFEFPTETSGTRLLVIDTDLSKTPKLGSLAPTRDYISNVSCFLSAITVANGNDGRKINGACDVSKSYFDLSANAGYFYTEYSHFVYSNCDLINAGLRNTGINLSLSKEIALPFRFAELNTEATPGKINAGEVILPFSEDSEVELYYSRETKKYAYVKDGTPVSDKLGDVPLSFDNVFVLFADTVTYEGSDSTEMVMNTMGEGRGFYITGGFAREIKWQSDAGGTITYTDESGEKITVNRGVSYTGFIKSSKINNVSFS